MTDNLPDNLPESQILFYQVEDDQGRIEVRLDGGTVWLSQAVMAELYQTTKQNISLHIQNIYEEGELVESATVKEYLTVQSEGGAMAPDPDFDEIARTLEKKRKENEPQ